MGWPGPMTHRQFLAWHKWLGDEYQVPSRSDWYLMQIACVIERLFAKDPGKIQPTNFKMKFTTREESKGKVLTPEQLKLQTRMVQAQWIGLVGATATGEVEIEGLPEHLKPRQYTPEQLEAEWDRPFISMFDRARKPDSRG